MLDGGKVGSFQIARSENESQWRDLKWRRGCRCLEKNPEHRPYIMELLEHPFITAVPENDYHVSSPRFKPNLLTPSVAIKTADLWG